MLYFTVLYIIVFLQFLVPLPKWIGMELTLLLSTIIYIIAFLLLGHTLIITGLLVLLFTISTPYPRQPLLRFLGLKITGINEVETSFMNQIINYLLPF